MKNLLKTVLFMTLVFSSCASPPTVRKIDVQGHRGCRGLMPENSVPGFIKALDLGVTTLEMDLVISGDNKVVVSHEPFFSHEITTKPNGKEVSGSEEKDLNLYQMTYDQIRAFDVGIKKHPRFPGQNKLEVSKPLFRDVVDQAEKHARKTGRTLPYYNIEIKRRPEWDSQYHPDPKTFAQLVIAAVKDMSITDRVFIQSFDPESLRVCHQLAPEIPLVLLVENEDGLRANINALGFMPEVYSPSHALVTRSLIEQCHQKGMQIIPWTVNEVERMGSLIEKGVDGIITDYPNHLIDLIQKDRSLKVK